MEKILILIIIVMIFVVGYLFGLFTATKVSLVNLTYNCDIWDNGKARPIINCQNGYYFKFWTQYEEDQYMEEIELRNRN